MCCACAATQVELWLGVQSLWMYMEAVFSGGDIVRQLPAEAKRFQNIDKSFMKARCSCACMHAFKRQPLQMPSLPMYACLWDELSRGESASAAAVCPAYPCGIMKTCKGMMGHQVPAYWSVSMRMCAQVVAHATDVRGVVAVCCGSDLLRSTLPTLLEQLELCQKSLAAYLEAKRAEFPRFYFVSDPTLLEILSLGSDPPSVVPHFQSGLFDSLSNVTFDKVPLPFLAKPPPACAGLHVESQALWHV